MRIAYFVTPHGFGHAARAAAVMEAVGDRLPETSFEVFTTTPEWFFSQSLTVPFTVRPIVSDVGLVQLDPMHEDLAATVDSLQSLWTALPETAGRIVDAWTGARPRLVVSDISPLGLEVAQRAGLPSVLIENFTWDWIYAAYRADEPALGVFAGRYAELVETVDLHLQCEPWCRGVSGARTVSPVGREAHLSRREVRCALGLADDPRPVVLLTMGGMGWGRDAPLPDIDCVFVTLGGVDRLARSDRVLRLPDRSPVYPPDLVRAADAVIGKLGYSTVAECFRSGVPLGFIRRPRFPESPVLEEFVRRRVPSLEISAGGITESTVRRLLATPRGEPVRTNGADQIAEILCDTADRAVC